MSSAQIYFPCSGQEMPILQVYITIYLKKIPLISKKNFQYFTFETTGAMSERDCALYGFCSGIPCMVFT